MKKDNSQFCSSSLTPNMEDYMETISLLASKNRVVRVKDIALSLEIKMPSVTSALNKLKEQKLIEYEKYGFIELTQKGREIAERIYFRHKSLREFFKEVLKLGDDDADNEACRIEHDLSAEAFEKIYRLFQFIQTERQEDRDWTKKLDDLMRSI